MAYYLYDPITNTKRLVEGDFLIEQSLDEYKSIALESLMDNYKKSIVSGFNSSATGEDVRYGYKEQDQLNYSKIANLFALNPTKASTIIGSDSHGVVTLSKEQFLQFMEDAEQYEMTMYIKRKELEQQIVNASTIDELMSVVIGF